MTPPANSVAMMRHFVVRESARLLAFERGETPTTEDGITYNLELLKIRCENDDMREGESRYACDVGSTPANALKNRYKDIKPYDYSRVQLIEVADATGDSSYINASLVNGAYGKIAYIAAQGPLANTLVDFWRMIVQFRIETCVMLCNTTEGNPPKAKCEQYWPKLHSSVVLGGAMVRTTDEQMDASGAFLVRTLNVETVPTTTAADSNTPKDSWVVRLYHYLSWPDHGCPSTSESLLEMLRQIRHHQPKDTTPILVNCSAGCGRTGTIIGIDYVMSMIKIGSLSEDFSIPNMVMDLRRQRTAMVQSLDQYVFLYKAILGIFKERLEQIDSTEYENYVPATTATTVAALASTVSVEPDVASKRKSVENGDVNQSLNGDRSPVAPPRQRRTKAVAPTAPSVTTVDWNGATTLVSTDGGGRQQSSSPQKVRLETDSNHVTYVKFGEWRIPDFPHVPPQRVKGPVPLPDAWK